MWITSGSSCQSNRRRHPVNFARLSLSRRLAAVADPVRSREQQAGDHKGEMDRDLQPICSLVSWVLTRKAFSNSTAEMATMAPMSFIFVLEAAEDDDQQQHVDQRCRPGSGRKSLRRAPSSRRPRAAVAPAPCRTSPEAPAWRRSDRGRRARAVSGWRRLPTPDWAASGECAGTVQQGPLDPRIPAAERPPQRRTDTTASTRRVPFTHCQLSEARLQVAHT